MRVSPIHAAIGAAAALLGLLAFPRQAAAQTIFSDDFSGGNPANASDFTLVGSPVFTNPGQYRIVNNPATAFTNGYASFFDHTLGTGAGAMLFFDGPFGGRIFFRDANLTAGVQYFFSFWGASGSGLNVPTLQATVNGTPIGSVQTTVSAQWQQTIATFTPGTTGTFTFAIIDTNPNAAAGNDGAVDDVLLTAVTTAPEPAAVALLAAALPVAVWARRRCRT